MTTTTCRCGGSGWRAADTGVIVCDCAAGQQRRADRLRTRIEAAQAELGTLSSQTLDTFVTDRPDLTPLHWSGSTYTPSEQRRALDHALSVCRAYAEQPVGWLYLCGPYGAGKSHLAAAVATARAAAGDSVAYASVPDLLDYIRRGYRTGDADARLDTLLHVDLLVLDDLGSERPSDWVDEQLFRIVNGRDLADRAIVATSNLWLSQHEGRIASRMRGRTPREHELVLPVADYRAAHRGGR